MTSTSRRRGKCVKGRTAMKRTRTRCSTSCWTPTTTSDVLSVTSLSPSPCGGTPAKHAQTKMTMTTMRTTTMTTTRTTMMMTIGHQGSGSLTVLRRRAAAKALSLPVPALRRRHRRGPLLIRAGSLTKPVSPRARARAKALARPTKRVSGRARANGRAKRARRRVRRREKAKRVGRRVVRRVRRREKAKRAWRRVVKRVRRRAWRKASKRT
mmetsp:Transcript_39285/g.88317  ORF Transcript_39285/g.88317 Transcript_39285/m.88317 type:complete len:211 (-) Transcript_39285:346-978(-)